MKTFDYTCRDAKGSIRRGRLEAPDRAGAVRALKARGLAAVSLAEGGGPACGDAPPPAGDWRRTLLWALPCAALALGAALWLWPGTRGGGTSGEPPHRGAPPEDGRPPRPAPAPDGDGGEGTPVEPPAHAATPESGRPHGPAPAPDGDGGGGTPVEAPPPERPPSAFSTATEQVLGWIANTVPGAPPPILPALPPGERENIAAILDRDIVLYADDSDRAAESKHNVAHAKQLLKRYLAEGGTPEDFLGYYHNALAEAHREWREAQRGVVELQRAGDEEGAVTFYLEQNAALGERGIKPVILPPALRHLLGEGEE